MQIARETITQTNFKFPGQTAFYRGKVRDIYFINNSMLIIVATDRISAFDVVLPKGIPFKGQVLNQLSSAFLDATSDIVPNWKLAVPDPMVTAGLLCKPFKVEMVVRGYLAGHAWREYKSGRRLLCGERLPEGLRENDPLPSPIITPTSKASEGHDMDITPGEIIAAGLMSKKEYEALEEYSFKLFDRGTGIAARMGLILVDTKYEFGKREDKIYLIDEVHTPDSSRYFISEGYQLLQENGLPQKQLSKEFARKWLMDNNFTGKAGQNIPEIHEEIICQISDRYIELYERLKGSRLKKSTEANILERIEKNCLNFLSKNPVVNQM
ncbi:MAG TPA: phosphoribosylaminoimidazolesuccinocarboxamide synthase [Bacteroidales bacterium]|nr:phosphoribosylaminoimidazolesuccinocarboxamide synthase [Bacteroidales bacterium]